MATDDTPDTPAAPALDGDPVDRRIIGELEYIGGQLRELVRFERERETAALWSDFQAAGLSSRRSPLAGVLLVVALIVLVTYLTSERRADVVS